MSKKSKKSSHHKVKKNPWKFYEARIDPELMAAWADSEKLDDGEHKHCYPHGKYPHPLMLDQMVDRMWESDGPAQFGPGQDCYVCQWCDPAGEVVPLRFVISPSRKVIHVDIITPQLQEFTDDTIENYGTTPPTLH